VSGNATAGDRSPGGGLWAAGAATLANATVAANGTEGVASTGGGIHAETVLNLLKSTVTGNLTEGTGASGGGLWAGTSRLAGDSIVLGNAATGSGAGVGDAAYGPAVLLTEIGENILGPQDADPAEVFAETVSLVGAIRAGALAQGEGEPLATVALLGQSTNPAIDTGLVGLLDEGDRGLDLNGDGDIADRISTDARGTGFPRDIDIAGVGNDGEDFGDLGAVEAARTNRAPIAVDDEDDLLEDAQVVTINVLANDSDPDSTAPLEIVSIDAEGVLGLAEIAQEGTRIVYRPQGLFESLSIGETSVQALDYTIEDEDGGTATATLRLTVIGVNDFPDAADDTAEIGARAGETEIDVLANDSDPDRLDSLEVLRLDTDDTQGAARIAADGLSVFYDPSGAFPDLEPGETTTDSFSYTVTDGNGVSVDALVTVTVLGEADTNTPPVAVDDTASVPQWSVTRIDPLADNGNGADGDPDGDSLAVTGLGDDGAAKLDTGNGIALLAEDGTVFYRSERDFVGVDRFDYAVSDGAGGTDTATVSVVVEPDERGTTLTLGEAQRVAYAYEAALDRDGEIELVGLNFWIGERFDGLTERGLARAFYESPEFEENYGEIDSFTDRALVEVFYRNVLDRDGEESGIVFWTGVLERPGFTREDLLIAFAESPENLLGSPQITTLEQVGAEEWAFA
jgi:VCBS repeat-containing protein